MILRRRFGQVKLGMTVIAKMTCGKGNTSLLRGPIGRLIIVASETLQAVRLFYVSEALVD